MTDLRTRLANWWAFDEAAEQKSADNPLDPLRDDQRRDAAPLLTLAFGWGFLVTGLFTGGALGTGVAFWPDLVWVAFAGNFINFVIGALVAYIAFRTACNSGLLFRMAYGRLGALMPVIFISLLTIGWQGIVTGAFAFAWAQSYEGFFFYAMVIFAGVLFTATAYWGVKGIEAISMPSVVILVLVGLYAVYSNVTNAGGWEAFQALSGEKTKASTMTDMQAINLVIGSWIVGAVVMAEYARFARKAWVALAIPFIVLIVAQFFLQIVGAMGAVVEGSGDFTTYMLQQGLIIGGLGLIGMSLALWTTGNANLYLPVVQLSAVLRRPRHVMTVICGVAGTILGFGIYAAFESWIALLGNIVPPLIGPVIVEYYVNRRMKFDPADLDRLKTWSGSALASYLIGAASTFFAPAWMVPGLMGLLVTMVVYAVLSQIVKDRPEAAKSSAS